MFFGTLLGLATIYVIFALLSSVIIDTHYTKATFLKAHVTASMLGMLLAIPLSLEDKPFSEHIPSALVESMISSMFDLRVIVGIFTIPYLFFSPNSTISDIYVLSSNGALIILIFLGVQPFIVGLLFLIRNNTSKGDLTAVTVLCFFVIAIVFTFIVSTKMYGCALETGRFYFLYYPR
ncbi:TPA: hypothetical protein I7730_00810 [Vibrio vulnificus]|uniref:Uncharacterized protein n=1 Tax=Vibrio vulnificus TaxID=672 RepID=A0A8H9K593_VIBVL|nr:hypothetical protein [Vibrio vulnificus]